MEDLSLRPFAFQQRVADCKILYFKYQGRHHEEIQREMRELGHERWNRRCLYADRSKAGKRIPGWPERFGWWEEWEKSRKRDGEKRRTGEGENLNCHGLAGSDKENVHSDHALKSVAIHDDEAATQNVAIPGGKAAKPVRDPAGSFVAWLKKISPNLKWNWKFQQYIYKQLERVTSGECKRLMLFVPPRHGKSELVTVRYAAWRLKRNPKMNIIIGSYAQKLANRFSRKIKNVLADDAARNADTPARIAEQAAAVLPHDPTTCVGCIAKAAKCPNSEKTLTAETQSRREENGCQFSQRLSDPAVNLRARRINTEAEWETKEGGGVRAVGVGAGITGFGADLIIVDDPVKSRAEAESETQRENVWNWFNDDLYTRLEPNGAIILIQTRWHEDDLAGRLLREMKEEGGEQWAVISLPAIAEAESEKVRRGEGENCGKISLVSKNCHALLNCHALQSVDHSANTVYGGRKAADRSRTLSPADAGSEKKNADRIHGLKTVAIQCGEAANEGAETGRDECVIAGKGSRVPTERSPNEWRDELGRLAGEALCPERFDEKKLEQLRRKLGTYSFSALYQQKPVPATGGFFKRHWFKIIELAPPGLKWKRGYDLGISAGPNSDFTATAKVAFDKNGDMYIDGVRRKRMDYPEQRRLLLQLIQLERDVEHAIEESANGKAVIDDLRRDRTVLGHKFRGVKATESKVARAYGWNALAEEGRVHLVRGAWNPEFLQEACSFPVGTHDDQIDAVSIAVKLFVRQKRTLNVF